MTYDQYRQHEYGANSWCYSEAVRDYAAEAFMQWCGWFKDGRLSTLEIFDQMIKNWPSEIKTVPKYANFAGCEFRCKMPDGIKFGDSLNLQRTRHAYNLPSDMKIAKHLYLSDSDIYALPKGLHIGGNLKVGNAKIKNLPDDIFVGGVIDNVDLANQYEGINARRIQKKSDEAKKESVIACHQCFSPMYKSIGCEVCKKVIEATEKRAKEEKACKEASDKIELQIGADIRYGVRCETCRERFEDCECEDEEELEEGSCDSCGEYGCNGDCECEEDPYCDICYQDNCDGIRCQKAVDKKAKDSVECVSKAVPACAVNGKKEKQMKKENKKMSDKQTVELVKGHVVRGGKTALVDEAGEALLEVVTGLFDDSPQMKKFLKTETGKQVSKLVLATAMIHMAESDYFGDSKYEVEEVAGMAIEAASRDWLQPKLNTLRPKLDELVKIGAQSLSEKKKG